MQDMNNGVDCGIVMDYNNWFQLQDKELQKPFGVYIKWNQASYTRVSPKLHLIYTGVSLELHLSYT